MIQAQLERAQQLVNLQRYKDAEKELKLVLAQQPENTLALALFSICRAELGDLKEATDVIQNAIGREPDNDYLFYLQALYFLKQSKSKEADQSLRQAITFDPHNADYFGLMAQLRLSQKEWQEALDYANKGLEADPDNVQCLNARSTALYKLDKKEEAYATIQEALNQDPENESTHTNLGWSLLEKGDHRKSLEHFREALKINPEYAYAKAGMVEALKARYLFYRLFLKYAFWINNFKSKGQWVIIIGLYIGFRVLSGVSEKNPELAVFINPLVYLYIAFALSTWIIAPLSNLFLRLNVYGRYALTANEIKASNFVGVSLAIGALGLVAYLVNGAEVFLLTGIFGIGMMIPLATMLVPEKKQSRNILVAAAAFLALAGAAMISFHLASKEHSMFFTIFLFGVIAYQWVANAFLIRE